MSNLSRIRIKRGDLELEVEGSENFVTIEAEKFLKAAGPSPTTQGATAGSPRNNEGASLIEPGTMAGALSPLGNENLWKRILEPHLRHRGLWNLRYAVKRDKDSAAQAALTLLAAHRELEKKPGLTALELMRALKASGYNPARLDTHLKPLLEKGFLNASGSRRARRYEITGQGVVESLRLAYELYPNLIA